MNDLPDYVSSNCHLGLFADGTKLQNDLDNIVSWSDEVRPDLNMTTCKALTVFRKVTPHLQSYYLGKYTMSVTKTEVDLGVLMNSRQGADLVN